MAISRRDMLLAGAATAGLPFLTSATGVPLVTAASAEPGAASAGAEAELPWRHALSLFGDIKYPAGFKRFDYVNADAPKGGTLRQIEIGTFDNFNIVVAFVKGVLADPVGRIYETLTTPARDEISTEYGLLAESASHPADFSYVVYRLREEAKWHDGAPVTVEDVIFSFNSFKQHHPFYAAYYRHVASLEKVGPRDVRFTFDGPGNRELPQIVGQLPVLPKHWWEGVDAKGVKRDVGATTLEIPLGSGPYRVREFAAGRSIVLERVPDYWGRDLNVNVGQHNFEELRFEYFRDSTIALEAFKGDQVDWRTESSAKVWASGYNFPAVKDKRVILEEFPIRSSGGMQCFGFNLRRAKFADPRVRRAFNYALDFEEMNRQLFFGTYKRISSYFDGVEELMATGLPQGAELEILETVRAEVPGEVFTTAYTNPVGGTPEAERDNLRSALGLFKEAGYEVKDGKQVDKTGAPFAVEMLTFDPAFERVMLFYKPSLERLGITVSVRTVDTSQYENRRRSFDFDIIIASWGESMSPGNEQREYWSSAMADVPGSRNIIGIKNPAIDKLIERVIYAKSRADLVAATRALDRVLLWNHYVVPQWNYLKERTARWDRFNRPADLPRYGGSAFPAIWWYDAERAGRVGKK